MSSHHFTRATLPLILAEFSALAATLYLFLIPAFKKHQGIIFPDSKPPGFETGWHHFGFWPPIPTGQPDMFVMYLMIAPAIIAGLGVLYLWIRPGPARATILWSLFAITLVTLLPRLFDFGFFFIPAGAFLFIAGLKETFEVIDRKIELAQGHFGLVQHGNKSVNGLIKAGFLLAVIGWLVLFLVPIFNDHGRVVSAWDKYSWNPQSAPIIFIFFTLPLIAAGAGLLAGRMPNAPSRRIGLWIVAGVMVFLVILNAGFYSLYYLPSALLFTAAAIKETRSPVEARNEGPLEKKTSRNLFFILLVALLSVDGACTVETPTITTSPTSSPPTTTQMPPPIVGTTGVPGIQILSVSLMKGTQNPGGPTIIMELKNIAAEAVVSLDVKLYEPNIEHGSPWTFDFGVSQVNPLSPGRVVTLQRTLINGGWGNPYFITISGIYAGGTAFSFRWDPPAPGDFGSPHA